MYVCEARYIESNRIKARRRISASAPGWPYPAFSIEAILARRDGFGIYHSAGVRSKQMHLASRFTLRRLNKTGKMEDLPISPITEHRHHRLIPPQLFGDHRSGDDVQSRRSADVKTLFV
jgi:hypothetical protein